MKCYPNNCLPLCSLWPPVLWEGTGAVRSPPAVLQEGSHVQGPGLPLLYTHPPTEAPPGPFRIQS